MQKSKKIVMIGFIIVVCVTIALLGLYELICFAGFMSYPNGYMLLAMLVLPIMVVITIFFTWIASLFVYNMGEISDRLANIDDKTVRDSVKAISNNSMQDNSNAKLSGVLNAPMASATPVAPAKTEDGVWFCGYCGAKNLAGRTTCWSCDKPKA